MSRSRQLQRRYRKVEIPMWTDAKFRALSAPPPNAQTLWTYLLCGQRTTIFPGLVVASLPTIGGDHGWPVDADLFGDASGTRLERVRDAFGTRSTRVCRSVRDAWNEIVDQDMAKADFEVGLIVLKKALFSAPGIPRDSAKPSSGNHLRGWEKEWPLIPECDLKDEYLRELHMFTHACSKAFGNAFSDSFRLHLERIGERVANASRTRRERVSNASPISYASGTGAVTGTGSGSLSGREREPHTSELDNRDHGFDPDPPDPEAGEDGDEEDDPPSADYGTYDASRNRVESDSEAPGGTVLPFPGVTRVAPVATGASPRDARAIGLERPDPELIVRRALGDRGWERLNAERQKIAAELGKPPPQHLSFMQHYRQELSDRLKESGPNAAQDLEHVFAVATAQARKTKTLKYLCGSLFVAKSWETKIGMDPSDFEDEPTSSRASPRRAQGSAFDAVDAATRAIESSMARSASSGGRDPEGA